MRNASNKLFKETCFMYLQGISLLVLSIIPPPLAVRSILNGFGTPSIKNFYSGKVLSIFVSNTIAICRLLPTNLKSDSNLSLIKFILR